jgi:hypothetical protein
VIRTCRFSKYTSRVVVVRTWGRLLWYSWYDASQADKFSDSPITRENTQRRSSESRLCAHQWRPHSSEASPVSCPCCLWPLLWRVHFSFVRTRDRKVTETRPGSPHPGKMVENLLTAWPRSCAHVLGPNRRTALLLCSWFFTSPGAS